MLKFKIPLLAALVTLAACIPYPETEFTASADGISVVGLIDDTTTENLQNAVSRNPQLDTIILQHIPGSVDDEASLVELSRFIRSNHLTTRVPSDGLVASGGTDMVVMGARRIIEPGACIGVHTWSAGFIISDIIVGSELSRDDPEHELYLAFYREMGIDEDFYWFTLNAAGPDEAHWMSPEEINRFNLSTVPVRDTLRETPQQRQRRCDLRL